MYYLYIFWSILLCGYVLSRTRRQAFSELSRLRLARLFDLVCRPRDRSTRARSERRSLSNAELLSCQKRFVLLPID